MMQMSSKQLWIYALVLNAGAGGLLFSVVGCGKQNEAVPPSAAPPAAEPASAAPPQRAMSPPPAGGPPVAHAAPPPASIPGDATAEAAAQQMTMELRRYVAYTRTIPQSFEDFMARHPMKFPAPPAGKKYAIEAGQVVIR